MALIFLLLLPCAALQPGISVVQRKAQVLEKGQSLLDLLHSAPKGMESWGGVFEALGHGQVAPEELQRLMQGASGDLSDTYVDPELKQQLGNETVKRQMMEVIGNKQLLAQVVQQDAMVQQMAAMNPSFQRLVESPEALQRIFDKENLEQLRQGKGLDEAVLRGIMGDAEPVVKVSTKGPKAQVLEGGVVLKQVAKGDEKTYPKDGDTCFVRYVGSLKSGEVFDSAQKELFAFRLGGGQVIEGWEVALRRMSLGERAVMQVPAALAYGEQGKGPIPANSDLIFEVELRGINALKAST